MHLLVGGKLHHCMATDGTEAYHTMGGRNPHPEHHPFIPMEAERRKAAKAAIRTN